MEAFAVRSQLYPAIAISLMVQLGAAGAQSAANGIGPAWMACRLNSNPTSAI